MKIGTNKLTGQQIDMTKNAKGEFWHNIEGNWKCNSSIKLQMVCKDIYTIIRKKLPNDEKYSQIEPLIQKYMNIVQGIEEDTSEECHKEQLPYEVLQKVMQNLINFFSEFNFEPSFRFTNTFAEMCRTNKDSAKSYVANYFRLTGNNSAQAVIEKMNSVEFAEIIDILSDSVGTKKVNSRLKIYYGAAGTGKTTRAISESHSIIVCHSAMLPQDLMEDFDFVDGKAVYRPSALQKAMTEDGGYEITMDEMNLLPFESQRFMQGILDGKSEITYKGKTIKIGSNFKVICTMNLIVNGAPFPLPEPLVDRAEYIEEFKLTADNLVNAL